MKKQFLENFSPSNRARVERFSFSFSFFFYRLHENLISFSSRRYVDIIAIQFRVQCEYYSNCIKKKKKKRRRERSVFSFFLFRKWSLSYGSCPLAFFFFSLSLSFFFFFTIFVTSTRGKKKKNARRLLDRAEGRAFKFKRTQVRSFKQSERSSLSLPRVCVFGSVFAWEKCSTIPSITHSPPWWFQR